MTFVDLFSEAKTLKKVKAQDKRKSVTLNINNSIVPSAVIVQHTAGAIN